MSGPSRGRYHIFPECNGVRFCTLARQREAPHGLHAAAPPHETPYPKLCSTLHKRATGKSACAILSLDESLAAAIDAAACSRGVTRSDMMFIIVRQHLHGVGKRIEHRFSARCMKV